ILCQEGQGKVVYRYALAIACAAEGDEMSIKKPEFDEGRTQAREGANKQVISSQADSLIKISRIWADFFPANTSNQPI
ncbi:hypothetical protein NLO56_25115, partial [Escherichia coli]|nr:hypothetical protein [Escherichia coli]